MAEFASRGQLAVSIYKALGIKTPSSKNRFSDGGYLGGVVSTLSDLKITKGIGGGLFGTGRPTTRGEAFTMIARALGLADISTSIKDASAALVDAGVVKGYYNDPSKLGLDDPLEMGHLDKLMKRIAPIIKHGDTGESIGDKALERADEVRDEEQAGEDPAYAAFLIKQGVRRDAIDDDIKIRKEMFIEDSARRTSTYGRAGEAAAKGQGMDFENRGLFRSGTRLGREADRRKEVGFELTEATSQAQRAEDFEQMELRREQLRIDSEIAGGRILTYTDSATEVLEDRYDD